VPLSVPGSLHTRSSARHNEYKSKGYRMHLVVISFCSGPTYLQHTRTLIYLNIKQINVNHAGHVRSVAGVLGYGLDGHFSIPGRGKICIFSMTSRPALGPTQLPTQWVPGALSLGMKRSGRDAVHSPPPGAEVKKNETIYPPPLTSSWHSA
jgi:hypothetical protein